MYTPACTPQMANDDSMISMSPYSPSLQILYQKWNPCLPMDMVELHPPVPRTRSLVTPVSPQSTRLIMTPDMEKMPELACPSIVMFRGERLIRLIKFQQPSGKTHNTRDSSNTDTLLFYNLTP